MAKGQYLTSTQKSIVSRYYSNADARVSAALQELVSDLALADAKAAGRLWKKAAEHLTKLGVPKLDLERSVGRQDVKVVAEDVAKLISSPGSLGGPGR